MKNSPYLVLAGMLCLFACSSDDAPEADPCQTNAPQISNVAVANAGCGQANGSLAVTASGGKAPYQYSVNGGAFQAASSFENLEAGNYTLSLRDANGCVANMQRSITEENNLQVSGQVDAHAGCGSSNGAVTLSASGGSGTYTYRLNNGAFQESAQFASLAPGNYNLSVKDENDCEASGTLRVTSGISFASSVQTIISTNCAVSGCHVSGTGRQNFTNFATIKTNAANIKAFTQGGTMPPAGSGHSLSNAEKQAIACWVDDGALNN